MRIIVRFARSPRFAWGKQKEEVEVEEDDGNKEESNHLEHISHEAEGHETGEGGGQSVLLP